MSAELDVLIPAFRRPSALAVTLAGLAAQTHPSLRVVISDQTPADEPAAIDEPAVAATRRVLEQHGHRVETHRHLPSRGMAEHRAFLLSRARAPHVLFCDSDILLDPDVVTRLLTAIRTLGCGLVGAAVQGLSYRDDVRPHEQRTFEIWPGRVEPERVRKDTPAWERWQLHNAANMLHLERRLRAEGRLADGQWLAYKVAWIGACTLFDRAALLDVGGFDFWPRLPPEHAGEDVAAQLRVLERYGGAGIVPSGAWHLEVPTTVPDRRFDAVEVVVEGRGLDNGAGPPRPPDSSPRRRGTPAETPSSGEGYAGIGR